MVVRPEGGGTPPAANAAVVVPADATLDLDGSGIVDVGDLLVIIAAWGSVSC